MSRVKPTRIVTPKIIQPGEGGVRPWLWVAFLIALGAWSLQVFEFAQQRAGFDVGQRNEVEIRLRERIAELEQERDQLRAAAARFERAGQIDRAAADDVKSEVKALQDERADLKREVAFLKTLVSGSEKKLALNEFKITETDEREYRFEVTLSKVADDPSTVGGQVTVNVSGQLDGAAKTLDMKAVTNGRRSNIGIRFKNFQKLKTELVLPEGFAPQSVQVVVSPDSKEFKAFEQSFDWKQSSD